jgi:hypothetical protein
LETSFFYWFADHILHPVKERESARLFGATAEEKTRAWWHQVLLYKCRLGTSGVMQVQSKLRHSKFSQMEE